jgi:hypothetical protein
LANKSIIWEPLPELPHIKTVMGIAKLPHEEHACFSASAAVTAVTGYRRFSTNSNLVACMTASLKAADTLGSACPAETALTPVGRLDAMRKRLAAVRAAAAAIRPALTHFYEKVRFAGMS